MDRDLNSVNDISNLEYIIIEIYENGELTNEQLKAQEDLYIRSFKAVEEGYNSRSSSVLGNIPDDGALVAKQYLTEHRKECIIQMFVPKGMKQVYTEQAKAHGFKSLNSYINHLLEKDK